MDNGLTVVFTKATDAPPFVSMILNDYCEKLDDELKGAVLLNNHFECISRHLDDDFGSIEMIVLEDSAPNSPKAAGIIKKLCSCTRVQVVLHTGSECYEDTRETFVEELRSNGTLVEAINSHHVPGYIVPDLLNNFIECTLSKRHDDAKPILEKIRDHISKKNFLK